MAVEHDPDADDRSVEIERGRVAHELHDGVLPLIFAARMHAQRLSQRAESPQMAAELSTLCDELAEAMAGGRRLLVGLHPPELAAGDWHQALRHFIDRGLPPEGAEVVLRLQPETAALPAPLALAAYRIVQEAVRNAIRHGRASKIEVSAAARPGGMRLTVRDNGGGFDPAVVPADRFGLRGIRQRASRAGGQATIRSQPGGGTTVEVDLSTEPG